MCTDTVLVRTLAFVIPGGKATSAISVSAIIVSTASVWAQVSVIASTGGGMSIALRESHTPIVCTE